MLDYYSWAEIFIKEDLEKGDIENARRHRIKAYGSTDYYYWRRKMLSKPWKGWTELAEQIFEKYPCGTFTAKDLKCNGNKLISACFWIGADIVKRKPCLIYEANLPLMYIVFGHFPLSEKIEKYYLDKSKK